MTDPYRAFLETKIPAPKATGFEVDPAEINPALKPFNRAIVQWAAAGGRRALFASFGLHKTAMQLELARLALKRCGAVPLICLPLGVRQEFLEEAAVRFTGDFAVKTRFVRTTDEADEGSINLTNYESVREGKLDPAAFGLVSLDEAAILRGFGGSKTFRRMMALFAGDDRDAGVQTDGVRFRYVATATPDPNEFEELLAYSAFLGVMDVGEGKAQPLDAKVLTPRGWRFMGEIAVGDRIIAGDGSPTRVVGVYPQGVRTIYRVTFSDGTSTECDAEHLWLTRSQLERNNWRRYLRRREDGLVRAGRPDGKFASVKTTSQIAATLRYRGGWNHSVPLIGQVAMQRRRVDVDPWLLGALLGDGTLRDTNVVFSTADEWMLKRVQAFLPSGLRLRKISERGYDYSVTTTGGKGGRGPGSNALLGALRRYGVLGKRSWEKSVPRDYLFNDVPTRLAVLRGLMDTDGTVGRHGHAVSISTASPQLADDVAFLVRSLGGTATRRMRETSGRDSHLITIAMPEGVNPFSLPRKADRVKPRAKYPARRYIVAVEPIGSKPAQCIAVDHPSRLYVTDDFVVTHNTRFFRRDSEKADKLTLHPHKEREFWLWVASWAVFVTRPSDLGPQFSDDGYQRPKLEVAWHEVASDHARAGAERDGQGRMFRNAAVGVQDAAAEKRDSLPARIAKLAELRAAEPGEHRIVWHDLEAERLAIEAAVPGIASIYGSQALEENERIALAFKRGEIAELATKPSMSGTGCNFQHHCARAVFLGIGFKFHDFIQAVHRLDRFGQARTVRLDLIHTEAEREVRRRLERRWRQHEAQAATMTAIVRQYGLGHAALAETLARTIGCPRRVAAPSGEAPAWRLVNADTVEETAAMADACVDLVVTSIPFSTQYEYTPSYNDFGHSDSDAQFWAQMDYLTPQLLRVLRPGRVAAIHVKDRIVPGGINGLGFQTVSPFSDATTAHFTRHGFAFLGRRTIVTDVVRENNQTYRLGWTEQCKDGSRMGPGMPEYVLLFRRPPSDLSDGYADTPVVKDKAAYTRARWQTDAHGFWRSSGDRPLSPQDLVGLAADQVFRLYRMHSLGRVYDHGHHVACAEALDAAGSLPPTFMLLPPQSWHPDVWTDIARMRTLNAEQARQGREMHLCPLQFDVAERLIRQHSMAGETVYDPFAGIGTVPWMALKLGRIGWGTELNPDYWHEAVLHLEALQREIAVPSLFDLIDATEAA